VSQVPSDAPPAPEVTTDELAAALDSEGAFVLDVRRDEEFAEKHIPGVVLIPLAELGGRIDEVPTDRVVWVVCAVGARSLKAATALRSTGIDAVSVAGGTNRWVEEGRPFETGA
jgi:rhodanese-related sulfurtransferase